MTSKGTGRKRNEIRYKDDLRTMIQPGVSRLESKDVLLVSDRQA